jgi:hypothetical protein
MVARRFALHCVQVDSTGGASLAMPKPSAVLRKLSDLVRRSPVKVTTVKVARICPDCGSELSVAMCCTKDDEWLFVCDFCKTTVSFEELCELAMDRIIDAREA